MSDLPDDDIPIPTTKISGGATGDMPSWADYMKQLEEEEAKNPISKPVVQPKRTVAKKTAKPTASLPVETEEQAEKRRIREAEAERRRAEMKAKMAEAAKAKAKAKLEEPQISIAGIDIPPNNNDDKSVSVETTPAPSTPVVAETTAPAVQTAIIESTPTEVTPQVASVQAAVVEPAPLEATIVEPTPVQATVVEPTPVEPVSQPAIVESTPEPSPTATIAEPTISSNFTASAPVVTPSEALIVNDQPLLETTSSISNPPQQSPSAAVSHQPDVSVSVNAASFQTSHADLDQSPIHETQTKPISPEPEITNLISEQQNNTTSTISIPNDTSSALLPSSDANLFGDDSLSGFNNPEPKPTSVASPAPHASLDKMRIAVPLEAAKSEAIHQSAVESKLSARAPVSPSQASITAYSSTQTPIKLTQNFDSIMSSSSDNDLLVPSASPSSSSKPHHYSGFSNQMSSFQPQTYYSPQPPTYHSSQDSMFSSGRYGDDLEHMRSELLNQFRGVLSNYEGAMMQMAERQTRKKMDSLLESNEMLKKQNMDLEMQVRMLKQQNEQLQANAGSSSKELSVIRARVQLTESRVATLQEQLQLKSQENAKLTQLCDELIASLEASQQ